MNNIREFTVFDVDTGAIRYHLSCAVEHVAANTPHGCDVIEGHFDGRTCRIENGAPVSVADAPPSDRHMWDDACQEYVLKPEFSAAERRCSRLLSALSALEQRQLRPLRELAVNPDDQAAKDRLAELENDAGELRRQLQEARRILASTS